MKKIIFFTITIILFMICANLVKSIFDIYSKQDILRKEEARLQALKNEQKDLQQKLHIVENPEFVEEQARDKLFLVKPGESVVILPQQEQNTHATTATMDTRPNWQKWLELFF